MRRIAFGLIALLSLSACGSSNVTLPEDTNGTLHGATVVKTDDFSFRVPAGWVNVTRRTAQITGQDVYVAYARAGEQPLASNVNVVEQSRIWSRGDFDDFKAVMIREMKRSSGVLLDLDIIDDIDFDGLKAVVVTGRHASVRAKIAQALVMTEGGGWVVTVTVAEDKSDARLAALFDLVRRSWTWR